MKDTLLPDNGQIKLDDLKTVGPLLSVRPLDVTVAEKCTRVLNEKQADSSTKNTKESCLKKDEDKRKKELEEAAKKAGTKADTAEKRVGKRGFKGDISKSMSKFTAPMPGFSLPFLEDPNQLIDILAGTGEASYFRIDFGHLVASMRTPRSSARSWPARSRSCPSSAARSASTAGWRSASTPCRRPSRHSRCPTPATSTPLEAAYGAFTKGDVIREGFYLDDLENGVDVPEVKLITTLQAGASVSIGIVSAGLKGSVTLTITLDLHDPNQDGKVRMAELVRGGAKCAFDAKATIEAVISVFIEINLLITKKSWDFDLLKLGPYTIFDYKCADTVPTLVRMNGTRLELTSGANDKGRNLGTAGDVVDQYDVRQFDTGGGARKGGTTRYEISAFGLVQLVDITRAPRPATR